MNRALVVDDDEAARSVLEIHLNSVMDCDSAEKGSDAISMVTVACQEGRPYSLICLDIMMPEMNGHHVLAEIRRTEAAVGIDKPAKVIMVTATGDMINVSAASISGCDAYLIKPYSKKQLMAHLVKLGFMEAVS